MQSNINAHQNPLDRNHDGKVNLKDLNTRDRNHDGIPDNLERNNILAPGMTQTTTSTTTQQGLGLNQGLGVNPLDRNGDGILDSQQGLGFGQTGYVQSAQRSSLGLVRAEPTVIETIQKDVVVQERIHPVMKEEIQPVIYREREQLDVRQVTQMMHETQIQPTQIQQRELAAEVRAPIVERGAPIQENIILPSVQRDATLRTEVVHAPIIEETIRKTVIEEIQPVLERDVFVPTVVQNTQPIYEKIVEAPTVYREVRSVQELGTRSIGEYPVAAAPILREAPILAPVVPVVQQPIVEHVTMSTTTTTTDSFIPAKMIQEGELRNFQPAANHTAPLGTRRV